MSGVMSAYRQALRTDPRFAACLAAILLLGTDDVPQPRYSTFWDPGGALMLSLVYGDCVGLIVLRRRPKALSRLKLAGLLFIGLIVKYGVQAAFYVENAAVVDSTFLLAVHGGIAVAASHDLRWTSVLSRMTAGGAAVVVSVFLLGLADDYISRHQLGWTYEFFSFAAMRALLPYTFWTAVLSVRRSDPPLAG